MGPEVNSLYDENYPFLAPDGITLYFSSNNPEKVLVDLIYLKYL